MPGITDPTEVYFKDGIWAWDATNETWVKLLADPTTNYLYVDTTAIETLLAGGLPSTLDADSLRVTEQEPLSGYATSARQDTLAGYVVRKATTPALYNVTMTSADTEYSQALPANTKKFLVKCRGSYDMKVCFTSGESGTTYLTVPSGMAYWEDNIMPSSITIYFQCATAAQVAEIIAWS